MGTEHMPSAEEWQEIARKLRQPFPASDIKQAPGKGGKSYDYIDARAVMDRLDEVVGPENWHDLYSLIDPATGATLCSLTLYGISKQDVGYPNNPIGSTDKHGNPMSDEPLKDSHSDALKRAAVKWGIGRFLYQGGTPKADRSVNTNTGFERNPFEVPEPASPSPEQRAILDTAAGFFGKNEPELVAGAVKVLGIEGSSKKYTLADWQRITDWLKAAMEHRKKQQTEPAPEPVRGGSEF